MRRPLILIAALLIAACESPSRPVIAVDRDSFVGNWYGVRPEGVTTFHSDSTFAPDGSIVVRFFSCLSNRLESAWTDRGTWSYRDDLLTITLQSESERESESYTHRYYLLSEKYDERTLRSESADYTFWLVRRWRKDPYDCSTTREELEADRAGAIADGRFRSVYPDYPGANQ